MTKTLVCAAAFALAQAASAGVVINIIENGGNVDATLKGKIDKSALGALQGTSTGYDGYYPPGGGLSFTTGNSEFYGISVGTWTPFGAGGFGNWDTSAGDIFHMFTNPVLGLPVGYVSNSPLSSSATKFGTNFATLGFNTGTYVTNFTGPNGVSDSVTVNIGVPAPGSAALLGLAGLAAARRRR
jgi:hypothetical protein